MIASDLLDALTELGMEAADLPVMLSPDGTGWMEVTDVRFDEDRVLLTVEPR